jgi:hypothetical protein
MVFIIQYQKIQNNCDFFSFHFFLFYLFLFDFFFIVFLFGFLFVENFLTLSAYWISLFWSDTKCTLKRPFDEFVSSMLISYLNIITILLSMYAVYY